MQFQSEFVTLLSRSCGTQRVKANNIYQEYIRDKSHLHMNATRWVTFTGFISHLGQVGIVRVKDAEKDLLITWIDKSPLALAKAEANMKKERLNKSDEQRERELIAEQIERAAVIQDEAKGDSGDWKDSPSPPAELIRNEGEKVKLSFSFKKPVPAAVPSSNTPPATEASVSETKPADAAPSTSTISIAKPAASPTLTNVFKTNVFKTSAKPTTANVFKSSSAPKTAAIGSSMTSGVKRPFSATEAPMQEDMEWKRRRIDREGFAA